MPDLDQHSIKHERSEGKNDVVSTGHQSENAGADHLRQEWMKSTPTSENANTLAQKIVESAQKSVGESLWKGTLPDELGKFGAAVSISKVLQDSGVKGLELHKNVVGLTSDLINEKHWTKDSNMSNARPGDIAVTQEGAHGWIALVGDHSFYTNQSKTGQWTKVNELTPHKGETFLLHPPKQAEK